MNQTFTAKKEYGYAYGKDHSHKPACTITLTAKNDVKSQLQVMFTLSVSPKGEYSCRVYTPEPSKYNTTPPPALPEEFLRVSKLNYVGFAKKVLLDEMNQKYESVQNVLKALTDFKERFEQAGFHTYSSNIETYTGKEFQESIDRETKHYSDYSTNPDYKLNAGISSYPQFTFYLTTMGKVTLGETLTLEKKLECPVTLAYHPEQQKFLVEGIMELPAFLEILKTHVWTKQSRSYR